MAIFGKLFGKGGSQPSEKAKPSQTSGETAVVLGELGVAWGKLVKTAKCLSEVQSASEGRAALREAASQVEQVDPKLASLYRQAAEMMSDAEIVPICHRSAGQLRQQAVLLGKAAQKLG